jgi:hypothetical protein
MSGQVCRAARQEVCREPMTGVGSCGDPTSRTRVYASRHDPDISLLASRRLPRPAARTIVDITDEMLMVFNVGGCG